MCREEVHYQEKTRNVFNDKKRISVSALFFFYRPSTALASSPRQWIIGMKFLFSSFEVESVINFIFYSLSLSVWEMKSEFIDHKTQNAYSACDEIASRRYAGREISQWVEDEWRRSDDDMLHTNHINSEFVNLLCFSTLVSFASSDFLVLWTSLFLSLLYIPRMFRVYWSVHGEIIQPFFHTPCSSRPFFTSRYVWMLCVHRRLCEKTLSDFFHVACGILLLLVSFTRKSWKFYKKHSNRVESTLFRLSQLTPGKSYPEMSSFQFYLTDSHWQTLERDNLTNFMESSRALFDVEIMSHNEFDQLSIVCTLACRDGSRKIKKILIKLSAELRNWFGCLPKGLIRWRQMIKIDIKFVDRKMRNF